MMDAKGIYEIVTRLPRHLWPKGVRWVGCKEETGWVTMMVDKLSGFWVEHDRLADHLAALIFVGHLTSYLIGEGYHDHEWSPGETDVSHPTLTLYDNVYDGRTLLEILVNAALDIAALTPAPSVEAKA